MRIFETRYSQANVNKLNLNNVNGKISLNDRELLVFHVDGCKRPQEKETNPNLNPTQKWACLRFKGFGIGPCVFPLQQRQTKQVPHLRFLL